MRVLFALPGLHRYDRGAEIAFISVARALARLGVSVTLIGSGSPRPAEPYHFMRAASMARGGFESFPSIPVFRNDCVYEEFTFIPGLMQRYRPSDYDVTLTCSYPFTNWVLRRPAIRASRPPHVFVTQNGDWPARANNSEYRLFGCEGLVCTNPDFYERNRDRWRCKLIPNGVDSDFFRPGDSQRQEYGLPADRLIVLMVSALIPRKRIELGIEAVSRIQNAHLVVAGDGPLRQNIDVAAARLLPGRFTRLSVASGKMPSLYRCADVFLHLAKEESFGNVFLEAMACGLPIVACDSPRLRWIVGSGEFLLSEDGPAAIASQIEIASRAPPDMQVERQKRVAEFSWQHISEQYRDFLDEVVCVSGRSRGAT